MAALTEAKHAGSCIVSEPQGFAARETITIAASQTVLANQVLGKVSTGATGGDTPTVGTPSAVMQGSAATLGNGTIAMADPAFGAGVQAGTYRIICVDEAVAADFEVVRPDGSIDGTIISGVAYTGQIKFTLTAGATAWAVGNYIEVPVTVVKDGQYKTHDAAATDGAQVAAAIAIYPITVGAGATGKIAALVRGPTEVRSDDLVWKTGITAPNLALGKQALAKAGFILR